MRILIGNLFRAVTLLIPADDAVDGDASAGNVRLAAANIWHANNDGADVNAHACKDLIPLTRCRVEWITCSGAGRKRLSASDGLVGPQRTATRVCFELDARQRMIEIRVKP